MEMNDSHSKRDNSIETGSMRKITQKQTFSFQATAHYLDTYGPIYRLNRLSNLPKSTIQQNSDVFLWRLSTNDVEMIFWRFPMIDV